MRTRLHKIKVSGWPILTLAVMTAMLIIVLPGYTFWISYADRINVAKQSMRFVAHLIAVQAQASIEEYEKMLVTIRREVQYAHIANDTAHQLRNKEYLLRVRADSKNLMDILILDATARVIEWTGEGTPPVVADRPYATFHIDNPDSTIYVGDPMRSKAYNGQWFFAVSLAARDDRTRLKNIFVAIVDIDHFKKQFQGIDLPGDSTLGLINKNGRIITREPNHDEAVGKWVAHGVAIWNSDQLAGNFDITSPFDQVERIVGFRVDRKYGFGGFASVSRDTVLKQFNRYLIFAGCLVFAIIVILVLLTRHIFQNQKLLAEQQQQLFTLAHTDDLTGLYNRRHFMELSGAEQKRAQRYSHPLSYMMVDIDFFKNVNDTYGHDCGDTALQAIADILRNSCRSGDTPCRYGGEEFFVMLPETSMEEAKQLAERLRKTVEETPIFIGLTSISLTISIGVATCDPDTGEINPYTVFKQADDALYQAKRTGRNRVC